MERLDSNSEKASETTKREFADIDKYSKLDKSEASKSDEWYTTEEMYKELCDKYKIYPNLDLFAHDKSHMTDCYYTKEHNSLVREWGLSESFPEHKGETIGFVQPPNSIKKQCIMKALEQWKKHDMTIMMLIPWETICLGYGVKELWSRFLRGEIVIDPLPSKPKFKFEGREAIFNSRNAYCVVILPKKGLVLNSISLYGLPHITTGGTMSAGEPALFVHKTNVDRIMTTSSYASTTKKDHC